LQNGVDATEGYILQAYQASIFDEPVLTVSHFFVLLKLFVCDSYGFEGQFIEGNVCVEENHSNALY